MVLRNLPGALSSDQYGLFFRKLRHTGFRELAQVACSSCSILPLVTLPRGFRAFGPCIGACVTGRGRRERILETDLLFKRRAVDSLCGFLI